MAQVTIAEDDYGFNLDFTLQQADGSVFDGTTYTATLKVWATLVPGTLVVNKACTWDVAASGTCHYEVGSTDFATAGRYSAEVECTKTGAKVSFGPFAITVTESG
jgi:hypothetical protein